MLFQGTRVCNAYPRSVSLILSLFRKYHSSTSLIFQSHFDFSEIFDMCFTWFMLICIRTSAFSPSPANSSALISERAFLNFSDVACDGLKLIFA